MKFGMLLRMLVLLMAAALAVLSQAPQAGAPGRGGRGKGAPADAAKGRGKGRGPDPTVEKAKLIQPPQVMQVLRPGLHLVINRGANTLFRPTSSGVIVVDTKLPGDGNFERLTEIIHGVTREPVTLVFNTHAHPEQAGNNDRFRALGAEVIATPDSGYTRQLGDVEVRAYRFGAGHTASDVVVHFPADRVIALGGLITVGRAPEIDYAAGGSAVGSLASLDAALKLEWDVAVPDQGAPQRRDFVEAYRNNLEALIGRGRSAAARGLTGPQWIAELKPNDPAWTLEGDWLDGLFAELSR